MKCKLHFNWFLWKELPNFCGWRTGHLYFKTWWASTGQSIREGGDSRHTCWDWPRDGLAWETVEASAQAGHMPGSMHGSDEWVALGVYSGRCHWSWAGSGKRNRIGWARDIHDFNFQWFYPKNQRLVKLPVILPQESLVKLPVILPQKSKVS